MTEQYYELSITADTNDADYVTSTRKVTMAQIQEILPIIDVIKNKSDNYGHNWPSGDIGDPRSVYSEEELTDEQIDLFSDYLPYGEYGIHTIETIEYYPYPEKVRLL